MHSLILMVLLLGYVGCVVAGNVITGMVRHPIPKNEMLQTVGSFPIFCDELNPRPPPNQSPLYLPCRHL